MGGACRDNLGFHYMRPPAQAAYHGVPLVTMPGHVIDQADNAVKAARLGFGIPLYVDGNFSAAALAAGLTRVLTEPQFRANAARVATKMRARRRTPAEESVGAHTLSMGFQAETCVPLAPAAEETLCGVPCMHMLGRDTKDCTQTLSDI